MTHMTLCPLTYPSTTIPLLMMSYLHSLMAHSNPQLILMMNLYLHRLSNPMNKNIGLLVDAMNYKAYKTWKFSYLYPTLNSLADTAHWRESLYVNTNVTAPEKSSTTKFNMLQKASLNVTVSTMTRLLPQLFASSPSQAILHIAASLNWELCQFNKTAFLHRILPEDETMFMEQPPG